MNVIRWLNALTAHSPAPTRPVPALRALEELGDRAVPSAASNVFVSQLYQDVLGRAASGGELASWGQAIDSGTSQRDVALRVQQSPEGRVTAANGIYRDVLGRSIDPAGLNYFANQLLHVSSERVEAQVLGSAEFFARAGGTNEGFVAALYRTALGRAPDAGGAAYHLGRLAKGDTRTDVAYGVLTSLEARIRFVTGAYQQFLHRAPEAAGTDNWVRELAKGASAQSVIAGITGSPEYQGRDVAPPTPPTPPVLRVNVTAPADRSSANGAVIAALPVTATGTGTGPIFYTASNLPPGLTINPLSGVISGTISATASRTSPHNVTVTATQDGVSDSESFTWVVTTGTASTLPFSLIDDGWVTLPGGTRYKDVSVGTGATARVGGNVTVKYTGYLTDGTVFDSNNTGVTFALNPGSLIQGWVDAIPGMKVGGVRLLDIPSARAYGAGQGPSGTLPPYSELVFRVELTAAT